MTGTWRAAALARVFELLYGPLGFLHELAGRVAFGPAWNGRRDAVVPGARLGPLLDVGCGEGRLLARAVATPEISVGLEPSRTMARRAARRTVSVVAARSQQLPFADASFAHVVATYPGPWIVDTRTWAEMARVARPGASIAILIGGTVTRGRGAWLRSRLLRLLYGCQNAETQPASITDLGHPMVDGEITCETDEWGERVVWRGSRAGDVREPERSPLAAPVS
jgi:SAM-dependent methyltransferase